MNYVHLGACIGDWDKTGINRCGFTEFIKKNSKLNDKIFLIEANPKNISKLEESYKNFNNAKILNLGVTPSENGEITFFYTEDDAPYYMVCSTKINHVLKHYPNSKINEFKIKTISINTLFKDYIKEKKEMYDQIYSMLDENDHTNLLKAYKLFVNYEDDDQMLSNININTLVTTGQNDVGSTAEMSKKLSEKIKNSTYYEIKNGKHLCNIECSEDFNKAVESFVDRNYDEA